MITSLKKKERKLLDLYYADQNHSDTFATEHRDIVTKLKTLQQEVDTTEREESLRALALDKFDQVADLLAQMDIDEIWNAATLDERKTLVEDLVDSVLHLPRPIDGASGRCTPVYRRSR